MPYGVRVCGAALGLVAGGDGLSHYVAHGIEALAWADIVLVPGYRHPDRDDPPRAVVDALIAVPDRGVWLATSSTWAFALAATGLLDGKRATTRWHYVRAPTTSCSTPVASGNPAPTVSQKPAVHQLGRRDADGLFLAQPFTPGGGFRHQPTDTTPSAYSSLGALRAGAGAGFTAVPPLPHTTGTPCWVASTAFTPSTTADLALIVDNGTGAPKVCSVA